ncbi:hypothetical protein SDRG_11560 [Saprolegnia diclina VS20]|uniref:RRM domain-containing protein n=1 Tax=Saprolegnia diclina (strain VS20) TaxID=1156394 RepID=T0PZ08_SAPDV|nr:hypothetical protein SDRG_11560 [Saprolegnia diclina VS20]EQC30799.1 hypothetical protein SDRG_11560 [Saprolegnia diclina VS20]|eukprot:XP_008615823.1 hypothetical protein SDRG_11560 [Saprolegnia diclina VS20]
MVARVYVGGLPPDVTEADLRMRFGKIAGVTIEAIDMVLLGEKGRGIRDFCYINLVGPSPEAEAAAVAQYQQAYNNTKWKGKRLRVELAEPSFEARRLAELAEIQANVAAAAAARSVGPPRATPTLKTAYAGTRIVF